MRKKSKILKKIFSSRTISIVIITLTVILPLSLLVSLIFKQDVEAAWMDTQWGFRRLISIPSHSSAENNVYVTVPAFDATDLSRFQSDCGDLRFLTESGLDLKYFVVDCDSSSTVHVFFPTLPAGTTTYYMYYGNENAPNGFETSDFSIAASGLGSQSLLAETVGPGPVGYWKFDEGQGQTVNDSSISGNNGTLGANSGTSSDDPTWTTEDQCISGKCLRFDGNDFVGIGVLRPGNPNVITIASWFRTGSNCTDTYECSIVASYTYGTRLNIEPITNRLRFQVLNTGATVYSAKSAPSVNDNRWHYAVGIFNGTNVYLYLDGQLMQTTAFSGTLLNSEGYSIGRAGAYTGGSYFKGTIDDVKIYPYARTAAQIKSDYLAGASMVGVAALLGNYDQANLSNGLVGYWKMDEASWSGTAGEVRDASGNGNNGQSQNATLTTGKFGNGGNFAGDNDYVSIAESTSLQPGTQMTISAWVKADALASDISLIDKTNNGYGFALKLNSGTPQFRNGTGAAYSDLSATSTISTGVWYHLVGTLDSAGNKRIYINGSLSNISSGETFNGNSTSVPLKFGVRTAAYYTGQLDEARIYNRALSADEVSQLYNFAPGPVGYWKMDEGSGSTALDSSGNGNNATWIGSGEHWQTGKFGKSALYNGSDYLEVSGLPNAFFVEAWTQEFWIKTTTNSNQVISEKGTNNAFVQTMPSGIIRGGTKAGVLVVDSTGTPAVNDNRWHHIAVSYDQTTLTIYIDGKFNNSYTGGASTSSATVFSIGSRLGSSGVIGQLDDFRIYNYARTPEQVLQDMQGGVLGDSGARLPDPITHYSFDEQHGQTANNKGILGSTANGTFGANSGVSTDDPTWKTENDCKVNGCVSFDGGDYINTGSNSTFGNSILSASAWVNFSSLAANQYIIGKEVSSTPYGGWMMRINNSGKLDFSVSVGATNYLNEYSVANMVTGTWYHILGTYDGETINLYLDGKLVATNTSPSGTITTNAANVNIGRSEGFGRYLNGKIDEVKIYNIALTPEQVRQDMNAGAQLNFGTTANSEASQLTDGAGNPPIAYFPFDEKTGTTVNDISGNNNTGSFVNSPSWDQGKFGSAVRFNGSSNYISLGTSLNTSFVVPYSISVWVKPESISNTGQIPVIGGFYGINGTKNYLSLEMNTGKVWLDQWPPSDNQLKSTRTLPLNTWSHIEAVQTATTRSIYINGVLNVTDNSPETYTGGTPTDWQIGGWSAPNYYFKGLIDELKIYNYARTPAQVAYDYNRGAPLAWWKMDECEGSSIHDSSGNNLHGTWSGAAGTQTSVGTCNTISTAWGNGATGKFNASLNFDGTDDYVQITDTNDIAHQTGDLSFGGWFKTTDGGGANGRVLLNKGSSHNWLYSTAIVNGQIYCKLFVANNADDYLLTISPLTYNDGIWHHSMCVVSGNTISNYIDGKLVATDNTTSGTRDVSSTGHLYIGAFHYNAQMNFFWNGQLDDIRVYNYGLSSNQIKQLYNGGAAILFGN